MTGSHTQNHFLPLGMMQHCLYRDKVEKTVCVSVWEGGWGEAGGWMPLPTRPQRYCDPASLVFIVITLLINIFFMFKLPLSHKDVSKVSEH